MFQYKNKNASILREFFIYVIITLTAFPPMIIKKYLKYLTFIVLRKKLLSLEGNSLCIFENKQQIHPVMQLRYKESRTSWVTSAVTRGRHCSICINKSVN